MMYATTTTRATRTAGRARPAPRSARPVRPAHVRAVLPANTLARAPGCACGGGCPRCRVAETSTAGPAVQAKLEIGAPNDQYEQEADRVADQVMRMQELAVGHSGEVTPTIHPLVQRQVEAEEDEEELQLKVESAAVLQRQEIEEEEEEEEDVLQGQFTASETPAQLQGDAGEAANRTGMPGRLKAGLEALSGMDLSGVRVHHNASKPAQLNALAYTQGQDIHVGPGQEKHLPHEGWHAVQQMQGRVKPTMQAQGVSINDDQELEREADVMGAKAASPSSFAMSPSQTFSAPGNKSRARPITFLQKSLLQRKCPCGGSSGLTGECAECGHAFGSLEDHVKAMSDEALGKEMESIVAALQLWGSWKKAVRSSFTDWDRYVINEAIERGDVTDFELRKAIPSKTTFYSSSGEVSEDSTFSPVLDPDTNELIGWKESGSVSKIYSRDGDLVSIDEPGLTSPAFSPLDIGNPLKLAGKLGIGIVKGVIKGGAKASLRGGALMASGAVLKALRRQARKLAKRARAKAKKTAKADAPKPPKAKGKKGQGKGKKRKGKKGGKHTCHGHSQVLQIPSALPEHVCRFTGKPKNGPRQSASSQKAACLLAKHAFNTMLDGFRGCRPQHVKCICKKR